ncbi:MULTISPECIES: hypothetical protein [Corallococcus]|uniref:hypothetical protein n=1 Tax=Corallococcus TaxID=83461 RepID=UPI0013151257|nr:MULTISPECIES: hypothetical protein [Corallococcus]
MVSRLFHVVLLALVTVLGLSFANAISGVTVSGLEWLLGALAFKPLSVAESGVVRRLAEWGLLALTGVLLGVLQSRVLRMAGLQASGWVTATALGLAVGLAGSRALAMSLGVPQAMAPVGLGVVMGLAQWSVLRREAHGAVVWVAACTVGYGLAGPAAAWGERTRRMAMATHQLWQLPSISWTAQAIAVVSLALCTAIGAAFILASRRTQVLPGPRSRMPGAVAQWAVLGVVLPLLFTMEARAKSAAVRSRFHETNRPSRIVEVPRPAPTSTGIRPGCASRGCGPDMAFDDDDHDRMQRRLDRVTQIDPDDATSDLMVPDDAEALGAPDDAYGDPPPRGARPSTPVVHDEHLYILSSPGTLKVRGSARWNNAASEPSEPLPPATH